MAYLEMEILSKKYGYDFDKLSNEIKEIWATHPCFSHEAHKKLARVHLPVAPRCNIQCNYCDRKISEYYHSARPGVTYNVMKPDEALEVVEELKSRYPFFKVVGIAGPGEPLFNEETYETFDILKGKFDDLHLCTCTNGLVLPENVHRLVDLDVTSLTITINAVDPKVGAKVYSWINHEGETLKGEEAARVLIEHQLEGVELASDLGLLVKINSVLVPGKNSSHMVEIAREIKKRGAHLMNIMPLISCGKFKCITPPSAEDLRAVRNECESIIPQFTMCKQCRADVCGIPGIDDKTISEILSPAEIK